jgi:predicted DNA-binding transcriptional regulator YafY
LRRRFKVHFHYRDGSGDETERTVWPLSLGYFGPVWLLAAWCELRADFRSFRLDRIQAFRVEPDRFRAEPGKTLNDFLKRAPEWTNDAAATLGVTSPIGS